jgi:hypothetical protein
MDLRAVSWIGITRLAILPGIENRPVLAQATEGRLRLREPQKSLDPGKEPANAWRAPAVGIAK